MSQIIILGLVGIYFTFGFFAAYCSLWGHRLTLEAMMIFFFWPFFFETVNFVAIFIVVVGSMVGLAWFLMQHFHGIF
jgi:hypothetical protein